MVNMKSGCGDNGNSITVFEFLENQSPLPSPSSSTSAKNIICETRMSVGGNSIPMDVVSARWD